MVAHDSTGRDGKGIAEMGQRTKREGSRTGQGMGQGKERGKRLGQGRAGTEEGEYRREGEGCEHRGLSPPPFL